MDIHGIILTERSSLRLQGLRFASSGWQCINEAPLSTNFEPDGWNILAGDGRKFSDGEPIFDWFKPCNDEEFEMPWLAQVLRTRTASYSMILLFLLVYLFVIVSSGPWWIGNG
jgi:hypothetical protein